MVWGDSMNDKIKYLKEQLFRIEQEFKERLDMIEEGIDDMLIDKQKMSFDFSSMSEEDIAEFRQLSSDLLNFFLKSGEAGNDLSFYINNDDEYRIAANRLIGDTQEPDIHGEGYVSLYQSVNFVKSVKAFTLEEELETEELLESLIERINNLKNKY